MRGYARRKGHPERRRRSTMILATAKVADVDQFVKTFSTRGAEKRREHGSRGSQVFRDPDDPNRIWVVFDWDAEGWERFTADPETPAIFQEAGLQGPPVMAEASGDYEA
jgi:quinol monooxygenase YgiN